MLTIDKVSFGKDPTFWTNVLPTDLLARHQTEVKRFAAMLHIIRWFEVFFALIPLKILMKIFLSSEELANTVALPMVALFLGTGHETCLQLCLRDFALVRPTATCLQWLSSPISVISMSRDAKT